MKWFVLTLTRNRLVDGDSDRLTKNFARRYARNQAPGFGLFKLRDEARTTATYYLPPVATNECPDLLLDYDFEETGVPPKETLEVVVGTDQGLDFWYE